jgi:hypothetical protein
MEVASLQHLGDSFSRGWLNRGAQAMPPVADADLGCSFGSSRSFIDMDPAELFSMRWTTTAPPPETDFEFGLPGAGSGSSSDPPSPVLVSASQIIRDGRLLPGEPAVACRRSDARERHGDRTGAPRSSPSQPLFRSAQSTPASLSKNAPGRRGRRSPSSSWKILVQYLRFLMPLYRKVRALRRFSGPRPRVAPASPARASTSSIEWCHGNADTAVRDAILYCKKSSVRPPITSNQVNHRKHVSASAHADTAQTLVISHFALCLTPFAHEFSGTRLVTPQEHTHELDVNPRTRGTCCAVSSQLSKFFVCIPRWT